MLGLVELVQATKAASSQSIDFYILSLVQLPECLRRMTAPLYLLEKQSWAPVFRGQVIPHTPQDEKTSPLKLDCCILTSRQLVQVQQQW